MTTATGDWQDDDGGAEDVGVEVDTSTIDPAAVGLFKYVFGCLTLTVIALTFTLGVSNERPADDQIRWLRADISRVETQVKALTERIDRSQSQGSVKP